MDEERFRPVAQPFWTRGARLLFLPLALAAPFIAIRFAGGLSAITNLTDQYPWGIWVAIDISSGIALAAGGFATAAFVEILGRGRYRPLLRTALLTAWLGYLMETVILIFDLGRYWNFWQPFVRWQAKSVLFEIAVCVAAYLAVLTVELSPVFAAGAAEASAGLRKWPRIAGRVLPFFIVAGVVLSFMHQSSLGTLLLIAPGKLSPLWYTPWLPLLFLLSAVMAGFPMVIIQYLWASLSFRKNPDMEMMERFARKVPWLIALYASVKATDLLMRSGTIPWRRDAYLLPALALETAVGVLLPLVLFSLRRVRRSPRRLFWAAIWVAIGVVINRINVFLTGYRPPYAARAYFPALGEIALTLAAAAAVILLYRFMIIRFPILSWPETGESGPGTGSGRPRVSRQAWIWSGVAFLFISILALAYTLAHRSAIRGKIQHGRSGMEERLARRPPVEEFPPSEKFPPAYRDSYLLENPLLNAASDRFAAVEFGHRRHDALAGGDCSACHHRIPFSAGDRNGRELREMHQAAGITIGAPCLACHQDLQGKPLQKCSACHRLPGEPDVIDRPGLMGAYHRSCLGCHLRRPAPNHAPTGCTACHPSRKGSE